MTRTWLAAVAYGALTIALTFPLILQMGSVLPNDAGDPALNTWILWWNAQAVPYTAKWWSAPAFYPGPGALAFSEHLLGLSLIATPLQWLGAGPQTAYNSIFLLTFPLSAIGAYLLVLDLTRRHDAAFIAGLAFGFAPYRIAHLPQIQSLAAFAMPFSLLGLHRYLREPRLRWLALFGAGWFLQGICNGYYLLFFSVMVGMWMLWFASPWGRPRTFAAILAAWAVAAVPLVPLLWTYRQIHERFGFARDFGTISNFGADVAGLLYATRTLAFWDWLHVYRRAEGELLPGLTITLLIVVGAIALLGGKMRARSLGEDAVPASLPFYALAGFATWLFSLGPVPTLMGRPLMDRGPYALLMFLPGFNALRVPARFWMMTTLCLAVVGAILFDRLAARWGAKRVVLAALVSMGVIADGWIGEMPLVAAPPIWRAESCASALAGSNGALVELPLGHPYSDVAAMYRSMSHGRPVVNGYSGYFPPHYAALRFGLALRDQDVLTQLAAHGVALVAVDREEEPRGGWDQYVASHPGVQLMCVQGQQTLYRLTATERPAAVSAGITLPVAVVRPSINWHDAGKMLDRDRTTRWESGPQSERAVVDIDLGAVRDVAGVDLSLGPFVEDFPRAMVIEISDDGQTWREVWRGGSAGLAYAGAFEAPSDVPLKYRFLPATGRYLRLRLAKADDTFYWSIAELKVVGP